MRPIPVYYNNNLKYKLEYSFVIQIQEHFPNLFNYIEPFFRNFCFYFPTSHLFITQFLQLFSNFIEDKPIPDLMYIDNECINLLLNWELPDKLINLIKIYLFLNTPVRFTINNNDITNNNQQPQTYSTHVKHIIKFYPLPVEYYINYMESHLQIVDKIEYTSNLTLKTDFYYFLSIFRMIEENFMVTFYKYLNYILNYSDIQKEEIDVLLDLNNHNDDTEDTQLQPKIKHFLQYIDDNLTTNQNISITNLLDDCQYFFRIYPIKQWLKQKLQTNIVLHIDTHCEYISYGLYRKYKPYFDTFQTYTQDKQMHIIINKDYSVVKCVLMYLQNTTNIEQQQSKLKMTPLQKINYQFEINELNDILTMKMQSFELNNTTSNNIQLFQNTDNNNNLFESSITGKRGGINGTST